MARQRKTPLKKTAPKPAPPSPVVAPSPMPEQIKTESNPGITAQQIRSMSVIQMRRFIESQQDPALDSLMDVYKRETLQAKLIEKLGL